MDNVAEIKQKLDIVNLVGEYVQLTRTGVNWKGRCPFHNEKTPSFFVNEDRQSFHCFGCGAHGDIFTFVEKMEGVEFLDALKLLADKAGIKLQDFDAAKSGLKERLREICEAAASYWQKCLHEPYAKHALDYVTNRGLTEETQQEFRIGYAKDSWDDLMNLMKKRGFTDTEIFQAGLTVKKDNGYSYYDRFRDRVIFPIQDAHGNVIGFTARTLKAEENAKYLNTPEGMLYHKGDVLYALDKARNVIRQKDYAVVVEGNMDAVSCHQAGFKNVVACSGTALTPAQISLLKRYTKNVALCFDQDEAGQKAAQRTIDLLLAADVNIKIVQVVYGKDPDECIKNDPANWGKSLKLAKSAMQYYFDSFLTPENLGNPLLKKEAVSRVLAEVAKLPNRIEKDDWVKKLAVILDVPVTMLRDSVPRQVVEQPRRQPASSTTPVAATFVPKKESAIERVLTIIVNYPEFVNYAVENLPPDMVEDKSSEKIYKSIIILYNQNSSEFTKKYLLDELSKPELEIEQGYFDSLFICVDKIYEGFTKEELRQELMALIHSVKKSFLEKKVADLRFDIALAEQNKQQDFSQLMKDFQYFTQKLRELK
jgi:DNA primase